MSTTSSIIRESLIFSIGQIGLASIEMDSRSSMYNNLTNQAMLDRACFAFKNYLISGFLWIGATSSYMYYTYRTPGFLVNALMGFILLLWLASSKYQNLKVNALTYNLQLNPILIFS